MMAGKEAGLRASGPHIGKLFFSSALVNEAQHMHSHKKALFAL